MRYIIPLVDGVYTEGDSSITTEGTRNDSATHKIIVALNGAPEDGKLTIQFQRVGSSRWEYVDYTNLSEVDPQKIEFSGSTTKFRFIVEGASGTGTAVISDTEHGEAVTPYGLYGSTNGMTPEEIGNAIRLPEIAACRKLSFDKPIRVVVMGASIMNGAFLNLTRRDLFTESLEEKGVKVLDVTEYAVGGNTSTDTAAVTSTVISDYSGYEEQTVVILHTGGNDISSSGPYPGGATTLDTNYRQIITDLNAAGIAVFPCSITYRIPPASNPSAPYNDNVVIPAMSELRPEALRLSGRPIIDLYVWTVSTLGIHDPDGIHYTDDGYKKMAAFIGSQLSDGLENEAAVAEFIDDVIIDFGGNFETVDFSTIPKGGASPVSNSKIYNASGKLIRDLTVSASGFGNSSNGSGKAYSGTGYSLNRNEIIRDSIFVPHPAFPGYNGDAGVVSFSGSSIQSSETYSVTITASRNVDPTTDNDRWGTYVCGGQSLDLNAADSTNVAPNTITFAGVSGKQLIDSGIVVTRRDPELNSFAYVSGVQITKTS